VKIRFSIILLAFIILVPPPQCSGGQPTATAAKTQQAIKHVEQGDAYFTQGLYDEAVNQYTAAIELDPRLAVAYWGRGKVYHFDKGVYSRAVDEYSKAIELDPKYTRAYYYRGLAQAANGAFDRAISDFSKVIELDPSLIMAYNLRAWCYAHKAQWEQSSQLFLYQLFESDSGLAVAYKGQGWIYVRQMQWELFAIPDVVKAPDSRTIKDENSISAQVSAAAIPDPVKTRFPNTPYVKVTPVSGPVGTKIFIYGWGFRANEDGMTITWDGEIIICNIRAELDGSLMLDGSKVPHISRAYTGDTRETVYVPPTTRGRHILGVYGSSFTPRGIVNDTVFEVTPEIKLQLEPSIKGTQVTITGTGFASNEIITISLDKTATNITATADNTGSFNAVLIIPTTKGKEYTIAASGNKGNSAQNSFSITLTKPVPTEQVPAVAEVYGNRGYAHFKKAQWALAIADLDRAYTRDPALNRGSWNKDWALEKQKHWDMVIADYEKIIALLTSSAVPQHKSSSGILKEELALALADYNKAAEISQDTAFVQKTKESIKFIEEWSKGIDK
jgi:tetratricopeptide (TPR) repeat protein